MNKEDKILPDLSRPRKIMALIMGAIIALVAVILILKESHDVLSMM